MRHALTMLALVLVGADEPTQPKALTEPTSVVARPEVWRLELADAIRIGLDNNSETLRVITDGVQAVAGASLPKDENARKCLVIAPAAELDSSRRERFRAEIMAEVRSIEQQYWSLAQQHVQLWCAEKAVKMTREILEREQAELEVSHGTVADVAEAAQRLEQFEKDLVQKIADVTTTERQLRKLMGIPAADDRRIVPCTSPTATKLEPKWEACRATMLEKQPDILHARELVKSAEAKASLANFDIIQVFLPELIPLDRTAKPQTKSDSEDGSVRRQREFLQQVVHQTTHTLARFCLEIDANFKQYQAAQKCVEASVKRLDAQRAFYEEGRITIDRYLDAVSQYVSAIAQEAQFKACYNTSIVALEEAKGTLLGYKNITIAGVPSGDVKSQTASSTHP